MSYAQSDPSQQPRYVTEVQVVARTVYLDVIDENGKPVAEVTPDILKVKEDGVEVPVLEVRPRALPVVEVVTERGGEPAAITAAPRENPPPQRYVVIALDPLTLGRRAWDDAIAHLAASAEALTAVGPVDVVALSRPPLRAVAGSRDPGEVRSALARIAAEVTPMDLFYVGRTHAVHELQQVFNDPTFDALAVRRDQQAYEAERIQGELRDTYREALLQAETTMRNLAAEEEHLLRESLGRLQGTMVDVGRPLVVVWAAQGDPDTAAFARTLLPNWMSRAEKQRFLDEPLGSVAALQTTWARWAKDGVTVVSWSREGEALLALSGAGSQSPLAGQPKLALGTQPFTLYQSIADATGGALVRDAVEIKQALASVGGRYELVYQSDKADAGWRQLTIEVARPGWTARSSPRQYVMAAARPAPGPAGPPIVLAVQLAATSAPGEQAGSERVQLPMRVDLAPLRERLQPGAEVRLVFRILATPPGGGPVAREVEVRVPSLPEEGTLHYETALIVPSGTSGYSVEVREELTGARGAAGPVEPTVAPVVVAASAAPAAGEGRAAATPAGARDVVASTRGAFRESTEVRISEARFLMPEEGAPAPESIKVVWKKTEQKLVRVVGGTGSSLELGIAIDVSDSAVNERVAFARAAIDAATRFMGPADRVFRVDFGDTARYLGVSRGGPGDLFNKMPKWPPEHTAIFDSIAYALSRFEGKTDRAALIVFTDGCQTRGKTQWRDLTAAARTRAIPVFVVMATAKGCPLAPMQDMEEMFGYQSSAGAAAGTITVGGGRGTATGAATPELNRQRGSETKKLEESRWELDKAAAETGGFVVRIAKSEEASAAWDKVENALARLWVAVFEPSDPKVDGRKVEVRSAAGALLRPSG